MTHGSLFSGIGGFDLAAEWMGWENKFHCEWNPFGQKVLHHYFPNAEQFTDITKTDFTKYANKIDILTGGFPCQPYSSAGKRLGKEDDRHLFPEMLRAIREIQPRWVVGENVLGIVNWGGGLVFNEVQTDLETEGYEVQSYVLPAVSVNAPHRRDRVWFVAYSRNNKHCRNARRISDQANEKDKRMFEQSTTSEQQVQLPSESSSLFRDAAYSTTKGLEQTRNFRELRKEERNVGREGDKFTIDTSSICTKQNATNTSCRGVSGYGRESEREQIQTTEFNKDNSEQFRRMDWSKFPTVSPICNGNDGIPDRLDSITFPKWRNESIKAGGNAVVPQVVYQIFKAIEQYEKLNEWT